MRSNFGSIPPPIVAAIVLAAGLLGAAGILGGSAIRVANSRATVTVTGSAKRTIRSDFAVWRGTFGATAPGLEAAYDRLLVMEPRVREYLRSKGVPDSAITFTPIQTRTFYEMTVRGETGTVTGYRMWQTVEVRSADIERITALSRSATELVRQGVEFETQPPEYLYTKLGELKVSMLADATRDAKARAEEIVRSTGAQVGRVRSARMGVFQITPVNSTMVADYGINDTSSIMKDITSVVSVGFEIR